MKIDSKVYFEELTTDVGVGSLTRLTFGNKVRICFTVDGEKYEAVILPDSPIDLFEEIDLVSNPALAYGLRLVKDIE